MPSIVSISVSYLVTMLWLTGFCNVFNFMDGINGLAGGTGVIYGMALFLLSLRHGGNSVTLFSLLLGGGCLGFAFLNFPRARTFMGDTGSLFLGFFFALLVVRLAQLGTSVTALVLVVSVFVFDSGLVSCWRVAFCSKCFRLRFFGSNGEQRGKSPRPLGPGSSLNSGIGALCANLLKCI